MYHPACLFLVAASALAACAAPPPAPAAAAPGQDAGPDLHAAVRSFTIDLPAPVAVAAPLFGPLREREWSPAWAPAFVHPAVPAQQEGAVFTTDDAHGRALWVLTDYAPDAGRIAYVVLTPGVLIVQFRIELRPSGADGCTATVTSRRSALAPAGNELVDRFAAHFPQQGHHWQEALCSALQRTAAR